MNPEFNGYYPEDNSIDDGWEARALKRGLPPEEFSRQHAEVEIRRGEQLIKESDDLIKVCDEATDKYAAGSWHIDMDLVQQDRIRAEDLRIKGEDKINFAKNFSDWKKDGKRS